MADYVVALVFLVIFAVCAIIAFIIVTKFQGSMSGLPAEAQNVVNTNQAKMGGLFDKLIFGAFILLSLAVIISCVMIDTHPVFFVFSVIIYILLGGFIMVLANTYDAIASSDGIAAYAASFPLTAILFGHLLDAYLIVGGLVMIVLYGKARNAV